MNNGRFRVGWAVLAVQAALFFGLPLAAGPADMMGVVVVLLAAAVGIASASGWCLAYPFLAALAFVLSLPLYRSDEALVYAVWYLIAGGVGMMLGKAVRAVVGAAARKRKKLGTDVRDRKK